MKVLWHIILGAVLTLIVFFISPNLPLLCLAILFLSSWIIDIDKHLCPKNFKKDLHLFHTVEFQLIIGALSLLWIGFFYAFMGLIFHSLTDVLEMLIKGNINRREFFLTRLLYNYSK